MKQILFILLAVFMLQNAGLAQDKTDQRTIHTRIADLLAQLPAKDAAQQKNNINEITKMGEAGFLTLISGLSSENKANNALLEYAIGGFSAHVTQAGQEKLRQMTINAYCKVLPTLNDKASKAFILSQFELVGNDDAIACLQGFLSDNDFADPAARALVKINSSSSKRALLNGLTRASGSARHAIILALGDSRFKDAATAINPLAAGSDQNLAKVSLYALAYIANPSSESVFYSAAEKAGFKFENTNAVASYVIYAEQLLKEGNKTLAEDIAKKIVAKTTADEAVHFRTAALKILVEANKENNSQYLLAAVDDKNQEYRAAALKFAAPYITPATTPLWIGKLKKSDDASKPALIAMLGESSSKEALPSILKLLKSKNQGVKLAAIDAAAGIGQEQVLDDLLKLMRKGDSVEIKAVSGAILRMKGNSVTQKVAGALPKMKPEAKIALINILASRAANNQLDAIYKVLDDKNAEVKKAGYIALSKMVTEENLPKLFTLLNGSSASEELHVQTAIIAALKNSADKPKQVDMLLQQMTAAPENKKVLFYEMLASLGGQKSLQAVLNGLKSGDVQTQKAAVGALSSWVDMGAEDELIKIARDAKYASFHKEAFNGYLRLMKVSGYSPERKLLMLRNAMEVAKTTAQKQQILKSAEQTKTFNSLVFAGQYLNDSALQQTAAEAVMSIALAGDYNGTTVKDLLNKTIQVISGGDSEYQKEAMRKYIAEMKAGEGFIPLFNGKDLSGWKGLVADPIKRSKMDAQTLKAEQEKADAEAVKSWVVNNGELLFTGKGNNLATTKNYGDFEMLVDWKIYDDGHKEGDAGIYLRGTPQVQIWDISRVKVGAQVGSGGLYNNKVHPSKPLKVADNKLGEWNTFHIVMKGDRVTVYLNGELVTQNVILENFWDRNSPIFSEEQIELQAHGSRVAYRDIYIKEIPRPVPFKLSEQEKKEGFKVLFDGTNMHSWTGNTEAYSIEDGAMVINPKAVKGSRGDLYTKEEFSDFVYRFEFKLTPGANNGLGIRAPMEGDAAYTGMELQILDNEAPMYKNLQEYQYHGSAYGILAAKRGFLKPVGEWNYQEVIVKGPKIKVILNGTTILDGDITEARKNGAADGKAHPGLLRDKGHIGFLGHGSVVSFKNIRIKDLSQSAAR